jgi:hypothetical protein
VSLETGCQVTSSKYKAQRTWAKSEETKGRHLKEMPTKVPPSPRYQSHLCAGLQPKTRILVSLRQPWPGLTPTGHRNPSEAEVSPAPTQKKKKKVSLSENAGKYARKAQSHIPKGTQEERHLLGRSVASAGMAFPFV